MKHLLVIVFLLVTTNAFSQPPTTYTNKIAVFCKVWGFLKYHHPSVAEGKYNWDEEFIKKLKKIENENLKGKDKINQFYYKWILSLGKLKKNSKETIPSNAILSNYDNQWLKDTSIFTRQVINLLLLTKSNSKSKNHYVKRKFFGLASASYVNENTYKDSIFPSSNMRLLTLARYWNIINYFYPYKYLTDTNWEVVIHTFVPKFLAAKNTKEYHLALLELFAKLNDSHTGFNYKLYGVDYKLPPFNTKIINNKIIILGALDDSICRKYDIRYGDVILKINGESIKNIIAYYSKYVSASNYASLCNQLTPLIIWSNYNDSVKITYKRNEEVSEKWIPLSFTRFAFKNGWIQKLRTLKGMDGEAYKILKGNICYINLANLHSKKEARNVLKNITGTNAVILDIRNYPNSSIFPVVTDFFCPSRKAFVRFAQQSIKNPGVFLWSKTAYCGKKGGRKYKGKVAVLINESTISFAEYFTMALKTIPNVILIGSHTAGADGSNNRLVLPGDIITSFSNEAVYYPNGDETQRVGILPDIKVLPTIKGIRLHKDEVLEKAIDILSKNKNSLQQTACRNGWQTSSIDRKVLNLRSRLRLTFSG